jgi:hypothetical protein
MLWGGKVDFGGKMNTPCNKVFLYADNPILLSEEFLFIKERLNLDHQAWTLSCLGVTVVMYSSICHTYRDTIIWLGLDLS